MISIQNKNRIMKCPLLFPVVVCVSEMESTEKCPNPREQLRSTPTAQIEGQEMIVLCASNTNPVFVCTLQR